MSEASSAGGSSTMSKAAVRKMKQRNMNEARRVTLKNLIQSLSPELDEQHQEKARRPAVGRPRVKTLNVDFLLESAIECVKAQLAKMEFEKASKAANFSMSLSPPHGISAQLPQIDHRKAVALQTTLATMLVRVRDMTVIESNAAMSLFCPFDFLCGYLGQTLDMLVHRKDRNQLYRICRGPSRSLSSQNEHTVKIRLLRVSKEESTGVLLAKFVLKEVTISRDNNNTHAVVSFIMSNDDMSPLQTSPTFWQHWLCLFSQFSATYRMEKKRPEEVMVTDQSLLNLRAWSSVRGIPGAGAKDTTLQNILAALMSSVGANYQRASLLLEESIMFAREVGLNEKGVPRSTSFSQVSFEALSADRWQQFNDYCLDGKLIPQGREVSGVGRMMTCTAAMLPFDKESEGVALCVNFMTRVTPTNLKIVESIYYQVLREDGLVQNEGDVRADESTIAAADIILHKTGPAPEPIRQHFRNTTGQDGFFVFPISVGNLTAGDGSSV